jgi:iron(III) transport system ATP-binding protein
VNFALQLDHIKVSFDDNQVLKDINLNLNKGDILGLLGPSGCGKTTLLNTIAGFIQQTSGMLTINQNLIITSDQQVPPEDRQVGMIFQDYALFPHLTVKENIAFGLSKLDSSSKAHKTFKMLQLLKLENLGERYPHELSGGQQQRVAIARALAPEPKLLLLDEPFSNIDARLRNDLMLELRSLLKKLSMSAIFVTHNKDEVFVFADKMAIVEQGKILQCDSPEIICQQPNSWQVADFLQLGTIIPATTTKDGRLDTSFGQLTVMSERSKEPGQSQHLLLKPQHLALTQQEQVNAMVTDISLTEHGYKLTAQALADKNQQVHVFSKEKMALGTKVTVKIMPHSAIILA